MRRRVTASTTRRGATTRAAGSPTYWSLDIVTGEIRNLGATKPDFSQPPETDRYQCEFESDANGLTGLFTITDTQTGMVTAIENVYTTWPYCPTDDDPTMLVWRYETADSYSLWMGPFTYLVQAPLPIVVRQVLWREPGATLVSGSSSGAPDSLGVFSIADQDPSVATEIIPATLAGAAWATGATPSTALVSSGLVQPSFFWEGTPGHYNYMRAMADGSQVMFIGPYAGGAAARAGAVRHPALQRADLAANRALPLPVRRQVAPHHHLGLGRARRAGRHLPDLA